MFEWDDIKDHSNQRKHGISLAAAADLFHGRYFEFPDNRTDYGERRMIAYGLVEGRVHCCIYTWRGHSRRIISLRKANRREVDAYHQRNWGNGA
jgi:uncharacterized DUF497 family protein